MPFDNSIERCWRSRHSGTLGLEHEIDDEEFKITRVFLEMNIELNLE